MSKPLSVIPTERQEDWWQQRHQQKLIEKKALESELDILFVGDSITHAWEVEGEAAWQEYFSGYTTFNLGYAGDRTEHLLWRIQNGEIDKLSPRFIVLLIGTNNAGHRHDTPEDIAAGVKAIIDELTKRLPKSKLFLMAIFPRSRDSTKRMRIRVDQTNNLIQQFTNQQHCLWLDMNQQFLSNEGVLLESVMPDLLHLNSEQYYKWAAVIINAMKRMTPYSSDATN